MNATGRRTRRRAVRRWTWRLFRREWRQQLLVIGLISFAVAAAVLGATAAYNLTPTRSAEFGSANYRFERGVSDPASVQPFVDAARRWFGTIEVIGHRQVALPGSTVAIELRFLERDGPYSGPMLAVRSGHAPSEPGEAALTDGVASDLGVGIGDHVDLGRTQLQIVGLVENPNDLDDEFAWVTPGTASPESITVLVLADEERVGAFRPPADPGPGFIEARTATEQTTAAVAVLGIAVVAMVLVCLVAGASFVTLAHRRLRQLGMLAAVGATPRQLRQAMVDNGVAVGAVAAVVGTAAGLATWIAIAPALEPAAAHRIDRLDIPLWLPVIGALLAVITATVAAWWPARTVARIPITDAVAARPPRPRRLRRSLVASVLALAAGVIGIAVGIDPRADKVVLPLFLPAVIAVVGAVLLASAPVLRAVAGTSGRLPVGARLAVRDLARFEARSAAALGAITLGLGIAVSVVVIAAADLPNADAGNLAADQLMVWTSGPGEFGGLQVPETTGAEAARQAAGVDRIVQLAPDATVVPLEVAVDPTNAETRGGRRLLNTAVLGRRVSENTLRDSGLLFVATPELLDHLSVASATIDDDTLVLTRQPEDVYITGNITTPVFARDPVPPTQVRHIDVPDYSSAPRTLITPAGMEATHLVPVRAGWLVDLAHPLSSSALAEVRGAAVDAGLVIENRDGQGGLTVVRTVATAIGVLVALSILAMTTGLLRSDAAQDMRTLEATGATRRTRRTIAASTCGVLALVGVVLAIGVAYAALIAGYWPDADRLRNVPLTQLATIAIGLPVLAAALAWILGGRERLDMTRPAD